ncbi:MAG: hypothetical protein FWF92_07160 [Oscillospiraceae bacterium]|nr:hypothetical protein [Oscillospiraceae bacterium]
MKKINKKILFVLIISAICMVSLMMMQTYAADGDIHNCDEHGDIEIVYGNIPADKVERLLNEIFGCDDGESGPTRVNLLCVFTNHIKESGVLETTEHNAYPDAPHCKKIFTYVEYCIRGGCDYFAITDRITTRIGCH